MGRLRGWLFLVLLVGFGGVISLSLLFVSVLSSLDFRAVRWHVFRVEHVWGEIPSYVSASSLRSS
jgi:hypothetical protein